MKFTIHNSYKKYQNQLLAFIRFFNEQGEVLVKGQRNQIKLFEIDDRVVNIKSFKIPNLINKVAYKFFRKSKARRSYEYASTLLEKGIGTPQPIMYLENYNWLGLTTSFYASEQLHADLTFRELVEIPNYPEHEIILRQFTQFCFELHEKGIEFLDHSPGNTLIKKVRDQHYSFYLVDLNRMNFHDTMDFDLRMKNLSRLTPYKDMIAVMSDEYAKFYPQSQVEVFEKMWRFTQEFQAKFAKKQRLKKKLKFWKS